MRRWETGRARGWAVVVAVACCGPAFGQGPAAPVWSPATQAAATQPGPVPPAVAVPIAVSFPATPPVTLPLVGAAAPNVSPPSTLAAPPLPTVEAPLAPPSVLPVSTPSRPTAAVPAVESIPLPPPAPAWGNGSTPPAPAVAAPVVGNTSSSFAPVPPPAYSTPAFRPAPSALPSAVSPPVVYCPPAAPTPIALEAVWNNGLFIQTRDKSFVLHPSGLLQFDGIWGTAQDSVQQANGGVGRLNDALDIRRARLRFEGTMDHTFDFALEFDAAAGGFNPTDDPASTRNTFWTPVPTDMYLTVKEVPWVGNVRIGQQKEPFGLERLGSARLLNFMERSYLADVNQTSAFNNNRSPGVSVFRNLGPDDRVYASVGVFKNVVDQFGYGIGDGEYAVTGRVAGLPVWNEQGKYLWHVGGAMSHRDPVDGQTRLRARPNVRVNPSPFANVLADTGQVPTSSEDLFGLETAVVYRAFTFQGEYQAFVLRDAVVRDVNVGDALMQGFYAEALYFLTGESRPYNRQAAVFGRVTPTNPLRFDQGCPKGWGAWELAARYSELDLNDNGVTGGHLKSVTLGLNWYWTANARMQFNYDYTYRDRAANPFARGNIHSFGTRLNYDF